MEGLQHTYTALAEQYAARFRRTLRPMRMVGREAEFPIVYPDGRAGDVFQLWRPLLAKGGYVPRYDDPKTRKLIVALKGPDGEVEVEVGRATVELVLGPYEDLWQLADGSTRLLRDVGEAARQVGMRVLGLGIQPRSRSSLALMSPKRRYAYFAKAVGKAWRHFTATAADQVHVDISRAEIVDAVNTLNLLSAPLIALTANSSVYAGRPGRYLSGREGLLGALGENRAGMAPRAFQFVEEFVRYICHYRCYVLRRGDGFRRYNRPFENYLRDHGPDLDAYLWHEHYTWNSARPRAHNSTLEIRPACQQPHEEPLVVAALALGWVEAHAEVLAFLKDALPDPWTMMRRYRRAAIMHGLRAQEPVTRLVESVLRLAEGGLRRRGRGEESFLGPLWERLERRMTPGDRAREVMRVGGISALMDGASFQL
ncbi:MAG TPA: glutamate-cysteine ligase family protein [bacterium]|nr:glutamate-cysteine ligase family protein [bacterium]